MADTGGLKALVINIPNNQPIEGATVKLSGPVDKTTKTASNGSFEFTDIPPYNENRLDVSADGFTSEYFDFIVVIENNVTDLGKLPMYPADID